MNSKVYKSCGVPHCRNTSKRTPNKLFMYVPHNKIRHEWSKLARRDPKGLLLSSHLYFCEDHFDRLASYIKWRRKAPTSHLVADGLPNDMENYMQYNVMGYVSQVRMKRGCLPTRFDCQRDIILDTTKIKHKIKGKRKKIYIDALNENKRKLKFRKIAPKDQEIILSQENSEIKAEEYHEIIHIEIKREIEDTIKVEFEYETECENTTLFEHHVIKEEIEDDIQTNS